jgi:hypothetical protein
MHNNNKITSKDISFVVQGIVTQETHLVLNNLRVVFPEAEIILSTWKNTQLETSLTYDILVLSEDPGAFICVKNKDIYYNLDRQLVSTQNGIARASRAYVVKLRSDLLIESTKLLNFHSTATEEFSKFKIFNSKIVVGNIYSRDPLLAKKNPYLFHLGDFFYFGLKCDIAKLFNIPKSGKTTAQYFLSSKRDNPYDSNVLFRYTPEQYIIIKNLQKIKEYQSISLAQPHDINFKLFSLHKDFLSSNFELIDFNEFGIKSLKYPKIMDNDLYTTNNYSQLNNARMIMLKYFFYRTHILIRIQIRKYEKIISHTFRQKGWKK